tara:strand:- start:1212 stop:2372 length:1161 start_codon:yes stop_codon:yes gene_type:complete
MCPLLILLKINFNPVVMKFCFSIFLFISFSLNLSSQIDYNWQNSKEGWVSCNNCNCNLTEQPDAMAMRLFSSNAKMMSGNPSANLGINGLDYNQVQITLKNPNQGSGVARLFIYPPGSTTDTCYYTFQVDTSMTSFSTYTISLDSIPSGGLSSVYNGPIGRFGLRAPWGGMNFDTVFWKQMIISNTNLVADTVDITFKVDMSNVVDSFSVPELNGTFNNWCGNCNPMASPMLNDIWEITMPFLSGDTIEYKFSADSWSIQETLDPTENCTNDDVNFTNRVLVIPYNDFVLDEVCWGSCNPCVTGTDYQNVNNLKIYPNPSSDFLTIQSNNLINPISIYDITGKLIIQNIGNAKEINIDISNLRSGLYFIKSSSINSSFMRSFLVNN